MADLKVRQLDERVARALKTRASRRGVSVEDEVRTTLMASGAAIGMRSGGAAALRSAGAAQGSTGPDSTRLIRRERASV